MSRNFSRHGAAERKRADALGSSLHMIEYPENDEASLPDGLEDLAPGSLDVCPSVYQVAFNGYKAFPVKPGLPSASKCLS